VLPVRQSVRPFVPYRLLIKKQKKCIKNWRQRFPGPGYRTKVKVKVSGVVTRGSLEKKAKLKFWAHIIISTVENVQLSVELLSEIWSVLSKNCNFLPPTFLTPPPLSESYRRTVKYVWLVGLAAYNVDTGPISSLVITELTGLYDRPTV